MEWEQIDSYHQRAKVFGGWLVKAYECSLKSSLNVAMTFVPDLNHEWKLKENVRQEQK